MDDWTRARQDLDARESSKKEAKRRITDDMSSAEKEQMMRESEQEQARKEARGKKIVLAAVFINIAASIFVFTIYFSIPTLIVQMAISVLVLVGVSWIRYPFALAVFYNGVMALFLMMSDTYYDESIMIDVIKSLIVVFGNVGGVILFINKSVGEYLYAKKRSRE